MARQFRSHKTAGEAPWLHKARLGIVAVTQVVTIFGGGWLLGAQRHPSLGLALVGLAMIAVGILMLHAVYRD